MTGHNRADSVCWHTDPADVRPGAVCTVCRTQPRRAVPDPARPVLWVTVVPFAAVCALVTALLIHLCIQGGTP